MSEIDTVIARLEVFPKNLRNTVEHLSSAQLQQRVVNWTIATNVHHICDSHMNSYVRIKLALTETNPTIKPYNESSWAQLADASSSIDSSLAIIENIHKKICIVLKSLNSDDWQKTFVHPELSPAQITLLRYVHNFADHGEHHLQNIKHSLHKTKSSQ